MNRRSAYVLLACLVGLAAAGCATQPGTAAYDPPGFFAALLHGLIAPIALVVGLFSDTRIYAFPNSGLWYDFGFLIGLSAWGGGSTYVIRN